MQDAESNSAKASKETHQAPKRFVSDVPLSSLLYIHSQLGDGSYCYLQMHGSLIVDDLEVCVDDLRGNHQANKCALHLSASYSIDCNPPFFGVLVEKRPFEFALLKAIVTNRSKQNILIMDLRNT